MNQVKGYYFVVGRKGYKKDSERELSSKFDLLGLEHSQPELGGDPAEIISQVIAYITIKEVWVGVASSIIFESTKAILTTVY